MFSDGGTQASRNSIPMPLTATDLQQMTNLIKRSLSRNLIPKESIDIRVQTRKGNEENLKVIKLEGRKGNPGSTKMIVVERRDIERGNRVMRVKLTVPVTTLRRTRGTRREDTALKHQKVIARRMRSLRKKRVGEI